MPYSNNSKNLESASAFTKELYSDTSKHSVTPSAFMRPKQQCALLEISRTKLWSLEQDDPDFPPSIRLSARCVGRRRQDLDSYLELKAKKAREGT